MFHMKTDKVTQATSWAVFVLLLMVILMQTASAFSGRVYSVTRVAPWDSLNVRVAPGADQGIVGNIPSDGEGVVFLGDREAMNNDNWYRVAWGSLQGWVNAHYLMPVDVDAANRSTITNETAPRQAYRSGVWNNLPYEYQYPETYRNKPKSSQSVFDKPAQTAINKNGVILECGGADPFWNVDVSDQSLLINVKNERRSMPLLEASTLKSESIGKMAKVVAQQGRDEVELFLVKTEQCQDGITNINYPFSVKAVINGHTSFKGCCKIFQSNR